MMTNDFEKAFDRFLDSPQYDKSANLLFETARKAFIAGWCAAGGEEPIDRKIFELIIPDRDKG